ncbi:MAG: J domain-containing protein [Chloroflexi bacterium]|nr:J domain-containing protein [Chloroflexota bacterium]
MVEYRDYYQTLGVPRKATDKEIREAFRRLARKYHPDVNPGNKTAEEKFKQINEAYTVLSDPEKRRKYDALGANFEQFSHASQRTTTTAGSRRTTNSPFDLGDLGGSRGTGSSFGGFSDFFEMLFDDSRRRRTTTEPSATVEQPLEITLTEAFAGVKRPFEIPIEQPCILCNGTGHYRGTICFTCNGTGKVRQARRVEVQVPAGVADGSRITARVDGLPGTTTFVVSVLPDPTFERKGDDLYVDAPVPLTTAVLGGEASVTDPGGKRYLVKVPPETENGRRIVLRGLGMPRANGTGRGDMHARIVVTLPRHLTSRERELFEELRRLRSSANAAQR